MSKERQQAIDKWFDSDEGKSCLDVKTLTTKSDQYLRNRLWKAFIGGMDAGEIIAKGNLIDKFIKLINSA